MAQSGTIPGPSRISGQVIIDELIRNMQLGRLELGYSVLVPCIFSVYLHPDDHARLQSVHEIITEDAKRALHATLAKWNGGGVLRRNSKQKIHRIAQKDWSIEFHADIESNVPPGDVEIHSELRDAPEPGYRGVKTTLLGREPAVTRILSAPGREIPRRESDRVLAAIRYEDDSGPQTYLVTQEKISIGRGGADVWVDVPLETSDEISREHVRIRRDAGTGVFTIRDQSRNGTWVNGKRLKRDVDVPLPDRAEIGLSNVVQLTFEVRHA